MLDERRSGDEDRVWYQADDGTARTVPRGWTDLAVANPFEVIAAGRAWFRAADLARLVALLTDLRAGRPAERGREV